MLGDLQQLSEDVLHPEETDKGYSGCIDKIKYLCGANSLLSKTYNLHFIRITVTMLTTVKDVLLSFPKHN